MSLLGLAGQVAQCKQSAVRWSHRSSRCRFAPSHVRRRRRRSRGCGARVLRRFASEGNEKPGGQDDEAPPTMTKPLAFLTSLPGSVPDPLAMPPSVRRRGTGRPRGHQSARPPRDRPLEFGLGPAWAGHDPATAAKRQPQPSVGGSPVTLLSMRSMTESGPRQLRAGPPPMRPVHGLGLKGPTRILIWSVRWTPCSRARSSS